MSAPLTPSKRPHDENTTEPNGKGKLQKSENQSSKLSSGNAVFRVLCPVSKLDSITGDGGSFISQICQETLVKVRVEETVPGCDERVIIVGSDRDNDVDTEHSKEDGVEGENVDEKHDDTKDSKENDENKESVPNEDSKSDNLSPSVQKALQLVFERIIEGETETDGGDEQSDKSLTFVCRLLVLSTQVGCLLGKGGSVVKQMSSESGAQIRILPRDKLPLCATASDELVQITGEVDAVRKALESVSQQLLENLPRDIDSSLSNTSGPSSLSIGQSLPRPEVYPPPNRSQGAPYSDQLGDVADSHPAAHPLIPKFHGSGRMKPSQEVLTFRLLCHEERVGGVIGKGGSIIKTLKQETGCEIKVMEGVPDSEDRLIIVSGPAHPDDRISPVQDAVLRVQSRIFRAAPNSKEQSMMARLLVSSNQIGCLLGKGGAIIAEMRKLSRAHIRIMGKDQIPKCAPDDEELVQINGEFEAVKDALLQITTRLRHHYFRDAFPSINYPPNPAYLDQPPFQSYMRRDFSPPGMHSNLGMPFHKLGGPPHLSERRPWGPQGHLEGGGPLGLPNFAPQRRIPGFGGSQPAIITNTTVEVVVPSSLVPVINGEDGECLKQIRQISDAKVTITEPKPGALETVIIISGTPEQTHAAQSLIQAFVMSETDDSS
ncbi:RNA-binding KH domain-containing protein PEPPER-like [Prunus yedoensis var. nudiflora]|uniref:RNA-binding KH domain-containing protein PEPPER-like n=1 Tax=Prunus yedoensis var. nudiflora TaxID=2094558 RepID=A0A314XMN1_PRUYE|nr:RNA-binding KH domain-containing protein PEPPER-like [Prunus yedoensis var. nudiflora]